MDSFQVIYRPFFTACLWIISVGCCCQGVTRGNGHHRASGNEVRQLQLPLQGVYESISATDNYKPRLDQIAAGGFKVVLNYSLPGKVGAAIAPLLAYADYANLKGLSVIWAMKNHQWWDGTYSTDSITKLVNILKNHPATWGYYVADDDQNMIASKVISYSNIIRAADPNPRHPRLTAENTGLFNDGTMQSLEPANDYIAYWRYGIGKYATLEELFVAEDNSYNLIFEWVKTTKKPFVLVMQANNVEACYPRLKSRYSHWPTAKEMTDLRNHMLTIAKAKDISVPLILWYSYFDIMRVNPAAWDTLKQAAFSPLPY